MLQRIAALALLAVALSGALAACNSSAPIGLRTATVRSEACDQALLAGELVASAKSGLAVRNADVVTEVLWPLGYSATKEGTGVVLRDETGKVLVQEGKRVQMSGGLDANGVWRACAGTIIEVSNIGG